MAFEAINLLTYLLYYSCEMILWLIVVFFYNYGWQDYSFGTMVGIADVVRVMQFELSKGKVAIHCHAGLGIYCSHSVLLSCWHIYSLFRFFIDLICNKRRQN